MDGLMSLVEEDAVKIAFRGKRKYSAFGAKTATYKHLARIFAECINGKEPNHHG